MSTPPPSHHDAEEYRPSNEQVAVLLDHASAELRPQFRGVFAEETVHHVVSETYRELAANARVHTHLTTLATRSAAVLVVRGEEVCGLLSTTDLLHDLAG
jgi:predicted transcriptional regulator